MGKFIIEGGRRLHGEITPQGAKNEALQILCATLRTSQRITVHNLPRIKDVLMLIKLLEDLGVRVEEHSTGRFSFEAADIDLEFFQTDNSTIVSSP